MAPRKAREKSAWAPRLAVLCVGGYFLLAPFAFPQGSLTPPGGPAPTMKTLEQIEPRVDVQNAPASAVDTSNVNYHFIINGPGSYYLSANLGVTKPNGIQINAAGVTLDLNGFEISRTSGSGGNGIEIAATSHRATVRNGTIRGFESGVISLTAASRYARGCYFRDLAVSSCTSYGISAGEAAVLEACRAHDNSGTTALRAAAGSTFLNCTASNNIGTYGFYAANGCALTNCAAFSNTADYAIYAQGGSALLNCTAHDNTAAYGIYAGGSGMVSYCSAFGNQSNAATSAGIATGGGAVIVHCAALSNVSTASISTSSTGTGFAVGASSTIENCSAVQNEGDGIRLTDDSVARDNSCSLNGYFGDGAGVHAAGSDNRIEGNNVSNNDRGIDVDVAGNVIVKNTASGNGTNYELAANNVFGAIVNRTAPASAAVSGNSAVSSAGTADPWANISY